MNQAQPQHDAIEKAQSVKRKHEKALLKKANVVGVGVGFRYSGDQRLDEVALVVMVERKLSRDVLADEDIIPAEIDGVIVDVQEVGQLRATKPWLNSTHNSCQLSKLNQTIVVRKRFCGPPESGNGGYVCGLVAGYIDGVAEIALRRPPPLEQKLTIKRISESQIIVSHKDQIIAEGRPVTLVLDVPDPPTFFEAQLASEQYIGFSNHEYPTCFVCGPLRESEDGLCIFPGQIPGRDIVAGVWLPDETLIGADSTVKPEFIWAALDCPGFFATWRPGTPSMLLGRLSAKIETSIQAGDKAIVIGWPISREGRKIQAGTAIFSTSGDLLASAKAVWIMLKEPFHSL